MHQAGAGQNLLIATYKQAEPCPLGAAPPPLLNNRGLRKLGRQGAQRLGELKSQNTSVSRQIMPPQPTSVNVHCPALPRCPRPCARQCYVLAVATALMRWPPFRAAGRDMGQRAHSCDRIALPVRPGPRPTGSGTRHTLLHRLAPPASERHGNNTRRCSCGRARSMRAPQGPRGRLIRRGSRPTGGAVHRRARAGYAVIICSVMLNQCHLAACWGSRCRWGLRCERLWHRRWDKLRALAGSLRSRGLRARARAGRRQCCAIWTRTQTTQYLDVR